MAGDLGTKAGDAFRTIGEMAEELGVKPHILRYWEEQFPMLRPLKRSGGRRLYRAEDVGLLHRIRRLLNEEGYTIRGARAALAKGMAGEPSAPPQQSAPAGAPLEQPPLPAGTASRAPSLPGQAGALPTATRETLRAIRARLAQALL